MKNKTRYIKEFKKKVAIRIASITAVTLALFTLLAILNLGRIKVAIYNKRGADYYHKGMYDKAIAEFQKALRIKPNYSEAHNNLGVIYRIRSMYDKAIYEFNEAIRLKPNFAIAHYNVARAYSQRNEKSNAIESLKKAISLDNKYVDVAKTDKAFENIRDSVEFQNLVF